ncbi:MAG: RadC family protein [Clostridia bacterium]
MADKENPHAGHRGRVRLRFENEGLRDFEPHQVLELLLFYSIPKRDTNEIAHRLLDKFGSLDRVFDAELSSLMQVKGVGYNTAVLLKLMPELAQYYAKSRFTKEVRIENSEQMGEYMCSRIGLAECEVFAAAAFDSGRNEIAFEIISEGILSQTEVQLRRLTEFAIHKKAEIIVVAHNHVASDPTPSQADRENTRKICKSLYPLGIKVADHIIVSGDRYYSFAMNNIMPM